MADLAIETEDVGVEVADREGRLADVFIEADRETLGLPIEGVISDLVSVQQAGDGTDDADLSAEGRDVRKRPEGQDPAHQTEDLNFETLVQ